MALMLTFATGMEVAFADDHPDGDTINATQTVSGTWGPGTISATTDVVINAGVVINIAPGTTILVADGVEFTVNGDLHSDGPVTFTTATSPAVPGAWEGITYAPGSSGYLNEATVEYTEYGLIVNTANTITISNSIIWTSWTQDTQADFQSDTLTNTDATTKPGSVLLEEAGSLSVGGVTGWGYRRGVFIDNNVTEELPAGYSVMLILDTETLVNEGKLQADGDDLRVVWDNGTTLVELDRVAETAFNSPNTEIWFKTQAPIPGNGRDSDYYIYYGNPSAGAPPANRANVYALWDDFDGSSLDPEWDPSGSVTVSGGQVHLAVGASIIGTTPYTYGVLEMRVQLVDDDDKAWWGWEGSPRDDDNLVVFQEYPPSSRDLTGLTRNDGGSYHLAPLPEPVGGLTTWHTYVADWWPGNARWLIDGTEGASTTVMIPDSGIYALFHARYVPMDVDWVKARLRVAQEPSVTLGTPQTAYAGQGQVLSVAFDTNQSSDWKYLTWDATTPPNTSVSLRVRTAATQGGLNTASWVDYPQSGLAISNDAGHWVQYEATLTTINPFTTPELHKVTVYYANVPPVPYPAIQVVKEASVTEAIVGETITYTYSVENIGDVTLTNVSANDDRLGAISLGSTTLALGEITTGTATYIVDESDLPGPLVNIVTVTGTPSQGADVTHTDTVSVKLEAAPAPPAPPAPPGGEVYLYLPFIVKNHAPPAPAPAAAPDLVVEDIIATSNGVRVVIKNQGDAPVLPAEAFWIDLYINPDPVPTGVNQTWNDGRCAEGIVWGIKASDLPLEAGGVITLTIGDGHYWQGYSNFSGSLPAGTQIYVQVDSANTSTAYGAVLENHEITGGPYNNISGPMYSTSGVSEETAKAELPVTDEHPPASSHHLPPRP